MGAVVEEHPRGGADTLANSWKGEWTGVLGHLKKEVGEEKVQISLSGFSCQWRQASQLFETENL